MRARELLWLWGMAAACLALGWPGVARAAYAPPAKVSVLTMGPGDHPFTRFGHNAILLEWNGNGPAPNQVYNFGTFAFDGLQGAQDFMAGRFRYWLSVTTLEVTKRAYAAERRSLSAQELELTSEERATLFERLRVNARLENRYYDYDYYRDNCSTRVRDALDQLLGGQLAREVGGPGRLSFRQHTLRLVEDTPWLYFGLDVALGTPTDRPTTRWEELFLPQELHDVLAHATRELDGRTVPLVRAESRLVHASRVAQPRRPPERSGAYAGWGGALGLLLSALGAAGARFRPARVAFGSVTALLGAALGLLGSALTLFALSKHWAAHDNPSLLACPPWSLALLVLGASVAFKRRGSSRALIVVLAASLATSLLLLELALAGVLGDAREALRGAFLFTPLWLGWLVGAWLIGRPHRVFRRAG